MRIDFETLQAIYNVAGSYQINTDPTGCFYIRFGYWKRANTVSIQQVLPEYLVVQEEDHEDEDSGWLFHYVIKHKASLYGKNEGNIY